MQRMREDAIPQFVVDPDKTLLNEEKVTQLFESSLDVEGLYPFFFFNDWLFSRLLTQNQRIQCGQLGVYHQQ